MKSGNVFLKLKTKKSTESLHNSNRPSIFAAFFMVLDLSFGRLVVVRQSVFVCIHPIKPPYSPFQSPFAFSSLLHFPPPHARRKSVFDVCQQMLHGCTESSGMCGDFLKIISKNFVFQSVFRNFAPQKTNIVKKGSSFCTHLVCATDKNHSEAADKRVRSLIFCVRTSGLP